MRRPDMRKDCYLLFGFERIISHNIKSSDDSEVEIPVPIPNTEVKHFSGEDSWACPCENSTLLVFSFLQFCMELLFLYMVILETKKP